MQVNWDMLYICSLYTKTLQHENHNHNHSIPIKQLYKPHNNFTNNLKIYNN